MTSAQGDAIVTPLYRALLPELGLQKRFPRIWRYAPRMFQALSLHHPYIDQGQEQVIIFQQTALSTEINGGLQRATTEQAQLEIGTGQPLLQEDFSRWGQVLTPNLWIGALWRFCSDFNIVLEEERFQAPPPQRENDAYLMEYFASSFPFSSKKSTRRAEWLSLNRCRLFLRVMFLSDITTGDGRSIRQDYLLYKASSPRPETSRWNCWPLQKPTKHDWTRWTFALRQLSSNTGYLHSIHHLGAWIRNPHQHRLWRHDPASNTLFLHLADQNLWKVFLPRPSLTRRTFFQLETIISHLHLPPNLHVPMVIPTRHPQRVEMLGSAPFSLPPVVTPSTIEEAIDQLGESGWPLRDCNWRHAALIVLGILEGTALGVCDGSYMPERNKSQGTAAWLLQPNQHV